MTEWTAENFGAELRAAREKSGMTLRQIADDTKLPMQSLLALEGNQVGRLPGGIYRRAIVRHYASQVGLDPEQTLRAFLALHPDDVPTMAALMPPPRRAWMSRALHAFIGLVSTLIPILAGVLYFTLNSTGTDSPRHIADLLPPAGTVLPPWHTPSPAADTARRDFDALSMLVSVSASTRLQIVADGREVVAQKLRAGDIVRLNLSRDVVLVGDNAGAVHFSINGRAGRSLGDEGALLTTRIALNDYQDWLLTQ